MRRCCSSGRSAWGCPIGGSAWPEPAWRCSCTWQGRRDDTRSRREELLAQQQGMCKLCGAPIALGTFEIDHVIPVSQSFSGQQLELQALCLECHHTKTSLEGNHSTTRRFSRYAYQNYAATPRLPPLVFQLQLPIFCPLEEGKLADLMWVDLPCDHRKGVLDRLPFVGKSWYAKPVCAYLLEAGLAQWQHFKWSLDACLELVLERMEQNWPEGEEHYARPSRMRPGKRNGITSS